MAMLFTSAENRRAYIHEIEKNPSYVGYGDALLLMVDDAIMPNWASEDELEKDVARVFACEIGRYLVDHNDSEPDWRPPLEDISQSTLFQSAIECARAIVERDFIRGLRASNSLRGEIFARKLTKAKDFGERDEMPFVKGFQLLFNALGRAKWNPAEMKNFRG